MNAPPPPPRPVWRFVRRLVLGLVVVVLLGVIAVVACVRLWYTGPEPVVQVETTALAPDAIATEGVNISPNGAVYFADGQGYVYFLDETDTAKVVLDLSRIPTAEGRPTICQIAFSPEGDLYIAHFGRSMLHRVNSDGIRTLMDDDLEGPNFVVWHPAGYVFLTDSTRGVLYRYDRDGANRIVIAQDVEYPNGFALTPDGRAILLNSCTGGRIYRIGLTEDWEAAGPPEEVRFFGKHQYNKPILDGMLRLAGGDYLSCDFFGNQLIRFREDGRVVHRIRLGKALNGKRIYPASLAQAPDGTMYVTNLGNVLTGDWGRGLYRFTLPPVE